MMLVFFFLQRNHLIKYTGWSLLRRKENDRVNLPQHSLPNLWQNRQMQGKQSSGLNKEPSCSVSRGIGAVLYWQADWHPLAYFQTPSPAPSFFSTPCPSPENNRNVVDSSKLSTCSLARQLPNIWLWTCASLVLIRVLLWACLLHPTANFNERFKNFGGF